MLKTGLAGVYDPSRAPADDSVVRALARALDVEAVDVVGGEGFVAACPARAAGRNRASGCAFDGWLLNTSALAGELGLEEATPEEVVAAGYSRWGADLLTRLRGSFALALLRPDGTGVIAQDHTGCRAVFYAEHDGRLHFASEVRTLLRLLPRRPEPDDVTVIQWLALNTLPQERTFHRGVARLGAGHALELGRGRWSRRQYWAPRYEKPLTGTREELVEGFWGHLIDAVHARSSGRAGVVMSGGIDSAAVAGAAYARRRDGRAGPRGYSAVFPGYPAPKVDESPRITALTDALGMPSVQFAIHPQGCVHVAADYARTWSIPLTGPGSVVERPLLERAAADRIDGLLDGQGGDELFGQSPYIVADRLRRGRILSAWSLAKRFPGAGDNPPRKRLVWILKFFGAKGALPHSLHARYRRRHPERHVPSFLAPHLHRTYMEWEDGLAWKRQPGPRWWAYRVDLMTRIRETNLLPDYVRHRAAAAGIEARSPLFDVDLLEFSLRLPPEQLLDPWRERTLIRSAMRGTVPDEVRLSPVKSDLSPFYRACLAGSDLAPMRHLLSPRDARVRAYLHPDAIDDVLGNPPEPGDRRTPVWLAQAYRFMCTEVWLRNEEDSSFADELLASGQVPSPSAHIHREAG